jgi:riboflavin synthase
MAPPDYDGAMFTGLIEEVGSVLWIRGTDRGTQLQLSAPRIAAQVHTGDSISVNGCCLTVASHRHEEITFDLLDETVSRTNLAALKRDTGVNLERALAIDDRLGGHFVQGHVDCTAGIISFEEPDCRLEIALPEGSARYVAEKGSIAVNGISLTVTELKGTSFVTCIIPHTRWHTNLKTAEPGELVNLEFDILSKYVERLLVRGATQVVTSHSATDNEDGDRKSAANRA